MKAICSLLVTLLTFLLILPAHSAKQDKVVYFDYDEFAAVRALDPTMSDARLCGLNKACIKLWKNGEMLVPEHGMVVRADFNEDGITDIGMAMEKDKPEGEVGLNYFFMTATKTKEGYKLMETTALPKAHTLVEAYWDMLKKSIAIDTGERQLISESTVTMQADGKLLGNFSPRTGNVETRLTYLHWDDKRHKFDLQHGVLKS